jgi:hemerythrin superfamily protein
VPTTKHVTDLLHEQHEHIHELFDRVLAAVEPHARLERFEELRRYLAVHETAEELVTHPVARAGVDGSTVVDDRVAEEDVLKGLLAELDDTDVGDPAFTEKLESLRVQVRQHIEYEEREEFPLIRNENDDAMQAQMARAVEAVEQVAPTRPHPTLGSGATSQLMVGPLASVVDRTKDAIAKVLG